MFWILSEKVVIIVVVRFFAYYGGHWVCIQEGNPVGGRINKMLGERFVKNLELLHLADENAH